MAALADKSYVLLEAMTRRRAVSGQAQETYGRSAIE
jgi:hypothetical protein